MTLALDHILWAAPDLDEGSRLIQILSGVTPDIGGSHPGFGTRNSLISLGEAYLEIISPDPAQSLDGNRGGVIAAMPGPGLMTFALRGVDLEDIRRRADSLGLSAEGPVAMHRTRPDGIRLDWDILFLRDASLAEAVPFVIDWKRSPHPAATTAGGCQLRAFTVLHPEADKLSRILEGLGAPIAVRRAAKPGFVAEIDTPRGAVTLLGP